MIERTAETRFELTPKSSPISSGVGTELRITYTPMVFFIIDAFQTTSQP
jgi:hypothetical protein